MAKDPAFLFYSQDFQTGTQFFTDEQVGIYVRLLVAQHQHGHLTDNQVKIICKSYDNDVMSKFLKDLEGKWYNERLELEIVKRKKYSESRSNNKKGKKHISKSYDSHMENENSLYVLPSNTANTNIEENSKNFNQFPKAETCNIILPESEKSKAIEIYKQRKGIVLSKGQVDGFFNSFKLQCLDGIQYYQTEQYLFKHFRNWLPGQRIEVSVYDKKQSNNIDKNGMVV